MDLSTSPRPAEGPHADPAHGEGNYPGRRIGRYVLLSLLGEGSMGAVWVADDPLLNIKVALKLLKPTALGHHGAERLLREARAVAQLKHPSIVQLLDFGVSQDGDPYLALELLEGETLRAFVGAREPTPELVVGLILPLLDALSMAHEHGIIHRDIKPDNLFVARDARGRVHPKVLDFGIAKSLLPQRERLTMIGSLIGTPAYMAPEQMRGDPDIDPRADLWALTVTMSELIAGFTPFAGNTVQHLIMEVLGQEPRSLLEVPGVDDELAAIIARGLAKDRNLRFPDARTMGNALALWLARRGVQEDACGTSLRTAWLTPGSAVDWRASRPSMSSTPGPETGSVHPPGVPMTGLETFLSFEACRPAAHPALDNEIAHAPTESGLRASGLPGTDPSIARLTIEMPTRTSPSASVIPPASPRSRRLLPAILVSAILAVLVVAGAWATTSSSAAAAKRAAQWAAMSAASREDRDRRELPAQVPSAALAEVSAEAPAVAAESSVPARVSVVAAARSAGSAPPRVDSRNRGRRAWY